MEVAEEQTVKVMHQISRYMARSSLVALTRRLLFLIDILSTEMYQGKPEAGKQRRRYSGDPPAQQWESFGYSSRKTPALPGDVTG